MRDLRTNLVAVAVAVGLGGLGGYAMGSNKAHHQAVTTTAEGTKVIRRTVHAKPHRSHVASTGRSAAQHALASAPVSTRSSGSAYSGSSTAVHTGSSGASGSHTPVHTGSSGSGGSSHPVTTGSSGGGGGEGRDGGGDGGGD